jgi:hypothetical protein
MPFPCSDTATTLPFSDSANPGKSPTCLLWTAESSSHIPSRSHAVSMPRLCRGHKRSLSERHIRGMAGERHGNVTAYVNQTRPHCVNQMGRTYYILYTLSGSAWQEIGMVTTWYVWIRLKICGQLVCCVLLVEMSN